MDEKIFIEQMEKTQKEIKSIFSTPFAKAVIISITSTLLVLLVIFGLVFHYRGQIFKSFATNYAAGLVQDQNKDSKIVNSSSTPSLLQESLPAVFSDESLVESAVEHSNPAVVAITISKEVPKYKTTYQQGTDPFQQFNQLFGGQNPFGNMQFQIPVQTPDGTEKQQVGAGSGFIVSPDGLIVTNRHVVDDTTADYEVFLSNGKKYTAKVLARDAILDVAIVKIDATGLPYLSLGNSDSLKLGQSVIAIGNALGQFQNTVSVGVVSGLSRSITAGEGMTGQTESLDHVIQTDAAINPGNSGGPLLDLSGNVVGVDTAIVQGSQNIGFALPINSIKTVIDSVKKTGKIVRPYLGIRYQVITPEMQAANNLTVDYGVIVKPGQNANELAVIPGSPADKAGIVENDIILEVDGVKLDSDHDLAQIIRAKNVGDILNLKLLSKGVEKTVSVALSAAPQD